MENKQKMVQFRFFKEALDFSTEKAQCIKLGNVHRPIKVWLPFSQVTVVDDVEDEKYKIITMPEWLFNKNPELAEFTDPSYL